MINQPEHSEPNLVAIEDLFRLKRAERPSPEFWTRFEQDLRAKQLAAIIEKRPWWIVLRLPRAARALSRFQVPMGAAAVLALSFVAVREYRPSTPQDAVPAPVPGTVEIVPAPRDESAPVTPAVVLTAAPVPGPVAAVIPAGGEVQRVPSAPGELMAMIPWAAPRSGSAAGEASWSDTVGELPQVHFASAVNSEGDHDFGRRVELASIGVSAVSPPVNELTVPARVSPVSPREVRRNRILSTLVVAGNAFESDHSRLAQVHEVVVGSLDDDRLYDSVSRLGMGGDRLTLKF